MSMYLQIEGVDGGTAAKSFEKQIAINSFSFSSSQPISPIVSETNMTTGRPSLSMFNITKECDSSSPVLLKKLWAGETLKKATFTAYRKENNADVVFLKIEMSNIVVANFSISGGGGTPYENWALNYSKIVFNYTPQKVDGKTSGNIPASYNLATQSDKD